MFDRDISLSQHSNYKIGGPARYFFEAKKVEDIIGVMGRWRQLRRSGQTPPLNDGVFILGAGTNILFGDEGFDGLIIKLNLRNLENDGVMLRVGAGVLVDDLLDCSISKSLSGLEWAGGLPGTVGGAIYGNAGAFGGEIKDLVREVISLDISGHKPKIMKRGREACGFNYRSSVFKTKKGKEIILEVALILKRGDKKIIKFQIEEKILYRKQRQPLEYPNIGSIFKNVNLENIEKNQRDQFKPVIKTDPFPVVPTAHLISEAGLKGFSFGGAMISPKHPNFIVNILNASSEDVKKLINLAKERVYERFGIKLEEEIIYLP